jgi:hypothetical protein
MQIKHTKVPLATAVLGIDEDGVGLLDEVVSEKFTARPSPWQREISALNGAIDWHRSAYDASESEPTSSGGAESFS